MSGVLCSHLLGGRETEAEVWEVASPRLPSRSSSATCRLVSPAREYSLDPGDSTSEGTVRPFVVSASQRLCHFRESNNAGFHSVSWQKISFVV